MIYQFKPDGTILRSVNTGLGIAGLAYNPTTQHLFVQINGATNPVIVLDASQPTLPVLGQFSVDGGFEISGNGAGFEMDCDGFLWEGTRANDTVYQFESGETSDMCTSDVPWLSEDPVSGTVLTAGSQDITLDFDAGVVAQPGTYNAELKVKENTPYSVANIPVTMIVEMPLDWGTMDGVVSGLEVCDAPGAPMADVTVNFYDSAHTLLYTATTDG